MFKKNKNKTTYLIQIPFPSAIVANQTNKQTKQIKMHHYVLKCLDDVSSPFLLNFFYFFFRCDERRKIKNKK